MTRSLKVRQKSIETVKQAMMRNGYPRQRDLADALMLSLSTVSKFVNGKAIDVSNFIEICERLGLRWQDVADSGEIEQVDVNFGIGLGANIEEVNIAPALSHVLHLSDLHFGTTDNARTWYAQLAEDLRYELACSRLDAVIISGDIATKSTPDEYAAAKLFINSLSQEFQLEPHQIVIVPGNHDINWQISEAAYFRLTLENSQEGSEEYLTNEQGQFI
jgi:transcriptional regulator with XRE-family HTH domain